MRKLIAIMIVAFAVTACAHNEDAPQGGGERVEGASLIDAYASDPVAP